MPKRVRLIDIAERLNLTKVSVSKALRDHPDISDATRALVKQTALEMGYSPNLLARSLSSRKSQTLGVVVPKIAHVFFSSVIDAIQEEATQRGYGIVLAVSDEQAELERRHIERLLAMRVDGLLVSVSQQKPEVWIYERVRDLNVPLVFFDRKLDGVGFSSVTVDDRGGARQAVSYLVEQGFRRIAHVAGSMEAEIGRARLEGYQDALRAHGLPLRPDWILPGGFDEGHGFEAGRRLAASGDLPEAIFAVTAPVGLGVRAALRAADPSLPERVQIVSFGVGGPGEFFLFPHLCVRQPTRLIGRRAVQVLLEEIEARERGREVVPRHEVLDTEIVPPQTWGTPSTGDGVAQG